MLKNPFDHPPDPLPARKGEKCVSEGHPQAPGNGLCPSANPYSIRVRGGTHQPDGMRPIQSQSDPPNATTAGFLLGPPGMGCMLMTVEIGVNLARAALLTSGRPGGIITRIGLTT